MRPISSFTVLFCFFLCYCNTSTKSSRASLVDSLLLKATEDSIRHAKEKATMDSLEAHLQAQLKELVSWRLENFKDEYGDPTNKKYVSTLIRGTFSNSVTADADLWVTLLVTKESAGILLHEYDLSRPAEKFSNVARIKLKNSTGKELQLSSGHSWNQRGGILIQNFTMVKGAESYDFSNFKNFLMKADGKIKCIIYDTYSSAYRFDIDVTGFQDVFNKL